LAGKREKLSAGEIATIRAWIDAGAHGPEKEGAMIKELAVPRIAPKVAPRKPITALAYAPGPHLLAVASYGEVQVRSLAGQKFACLVKCCRGNINALAFSSDGSTLFTAGGEPGRFGEAQQWRIADATLLRTFNGHKDALYAAALSPDGRILATGSYDQKIKLWDAESGSEMRTLSGHNGAVYGLAFRPDGKILASASGDRTVKLWDVASGERRDTLSQSLKELYSVAFSPDGKRLVAGGVDNRIRIWEISESATETTDPLLDAKYAHEGAILNLVFSADGSLLLSSAEDSTVKVWDGTAIKERYMLERQSDWARALAFGANDRTIVIGRMDGTLGFYSAATGKATPALEAEMSRPPWQATSPGVTAETGGPPP
jgi:WD40 repeat protein